MNAAKLLMILSGGILIALVSVIVVKFLYFQQIGACLISASILFSAGFLAYRKGV